MRKIGRRTVLRAAPVAVALPPLWTLQLSPREKTEWVALAQRTLPHRLSSQAIGQRYRSQYSPKQTERLLASVTSRLSAATGIASETEIVHAAIRADYARARTARVDGWVLSETEIALAVLSLEGGAA